VKVHLLSVVGSFVETLPQLGHMLAHYRTLGLDSFFLHANPRSPDDPVLPKIREVAGRFGIELASVQTGAWVETEHALTGATMRAHPNDWFVLVDADEFHLYPEDLFTLIERCERDGFDHLLGCFVDRFGPGGSLPNVDPEAPLWPQFPLGAFVTFPVQHCSPFKVVAAKGAVPLAAGRHCADSENPCPPARCLTQIHHFKWTAGIFADLERRIEYFQSRGDGRWLECVRCLDYFRRNQWKLDLNDPRLHVAECDPGYRAWDSVLQLVRRHQRLGIVPELLALVDDLKEENRALKKLVSDLRTSSQDKARSVGSGPPDQPGCESTLDPPCP